MRTKINCDVTWISAWNGCKALFIQSKCDRTMVSLHTCPVVLLPINMVTQPPLGGRSLSRKLRLAFWPTHKNRETSSTTVRNHLLQVLHSMAPFFATTNWFPSLTSPFMSLHITLSTKCSLTLLTSHSLFY